MLKRIKETLTCTDSSGISRIKPKLKSHLLHSDKSTYFYKNNGKVKSILYSPSIPLLGGIALLLVLCLTILSVGIPNNGEAYAETINYPAGDRNDAASISFTLNGKDIDGSEVSTNVIQDEVSYISSDLQVTTNNIGKFAVVVQSASNTGNLVNSDNGAVIEPISSATTPANFANNTWGYTVSDNISAVNSALTYSPLLAFRENPTAQYTKNKPTDGSYNLKLVFAAKIGSNKPAGHYKTTALLSVVAEANTITTYSINYNANGGTGAANPATQNAESSDVVYTFNAAARGTLAKTNYTFLGWSESSTATSPQYSAGSPITLNSSAPSKTLYAVWDYIAPVNSWSSLKYMQQMTSAACSSASTNASKTLYDSTAGSSSKKTYTVQKIGSECWMAQNMDNETKRAHHDDTYGGYYFWDGAVNVCSQMGDGWTLPTKNQYQSILDSYGSNSTLMNSPYKFLAGGQYITSITDAGKTGFYISSTVDQNYYVLWFGGTSGPSVMTIRYSNGYSVRCVAK